MATGVFQIANEVSREDDARAHYFRRLRDLAVKTRLTVSFPLMPGRLLRLTRR
jgi:hypothetical protein